MDLGKYFGDLLNFLVIRLRFSALILHSIECPLSFILLRYSGNAKSECTSI